MFAKLTPNTVAVALPVEVRNYDGSRPGFILHVASTKNQILVRTATGEDVEAKWYPSAHLYATEEGDFVHFPTVRD